MIKIITTEKDRFHAPGTELEIAENMAEHLVELGKAVYKDSSDQPEIKTSKKTKK